MSPYLTYTDIKKMIDMFGLPDTVLYYLNDPDTGETLVEDPVLSETVENLRLHLSEFLVYLELIEQ